MYLLLSSVAHLLPHIFATALSLPNEPTTIHTVPAEKNTSVGKIAPACFADIETIAEALASAKNNMPTTTSIVR